MYIKQNFGIGRGFEAVNTFRKGDNKKIKLSRYKSWVRVKRAKRLQKIKKEEHASLIFYETINFIPAHFVPTELYFKCIFLQFSLRYYNYKLI